MDEALRLFQEAGQKFVLSHCLVELSNLFYLQGNLEEFKRYFRECLSLRNALDELFKMYILMNIINSLYRQQPNVSAQILGVIENWTGENYFSFMPAEKRYCVQAESYVRKTIGDAAYESEFVDGQKLSLGEGLDLALKTVEEM